MQSNHLILTTGGGTLKNNSICPVIIKDGNFFVLYVYLLGEGFDGMICCPSQLLYFIGHRAYISAARRVTPSVPRELEEYIATAYSSIRQDEAKSNAPHSYTTVRTLLSILRISIVCFTFSSLFYLKTAMSIELNCFVVPIP